MSTTHTPSPWIAKLNDVGSFDIWTPTDSRPGSLNNFIVADSIQSSDDARLIAAAPDLLDALIGSLYALEMVEVEMAKYAFETPAHYSAKSRLASARAAIAKAEAAQ